MKSTLFAGLVGGLFLIGAPLALAANTITFDADTPATPQPAFSFFCTSYVSPFISGGYYQPGSGGSCTYGLPAQQMSGPSIFLAVYKGTPGNATLTNFFDGPLPPHSILTDSPHGFSGSQGDDYFSVAVAYSDFNDLLAEDAALRTGGTPPLPYSSLAWKWGVDPSIIPTPQTSPLTVAADSASVVYGSPIPTLTASQSGFVNGDTSTSNDVTGAASCTTSAVQGSPAGEYPITCALGTLSSAANYTFDTFVPGTLTITKAPSTTSLTCPLSVLYSGLAQTPCTASVSGAGALNQSVPVSYTNNTAAGTAHASASYEGDANHDASATTNTFAITYRFDGFLQPINDTAHQVGQSMSVFKGGSTVPVKFQVKKADGTVVQASSLPLWLTPVKLGLMSSSIDELVYSDAGDSGATYKWDGSQYQYNWSTKGLAPGYWYRIFAKLDDGEIFSVVIGLK